MLHKTRGIVFRLTKYGDASIIVTIFTELFGLQTYIVNGVRSKSAKNKIALYQPLTLLDLVVYYKENAAIKRIKEVKCLYPYQTLQQDIHKSAMVMFINEVLNKAVKEENHAQELFEFLLHALILLDQQQRGFENFHLILLLKLSRFLGFGAHTIDALAGRTFVNQEEEGLLKKLIMADFETGLMLTTHQRRRVLDVVLQFYAQHIDSFGEVRSVQVLREVMR
jgi:DNA repair protein RecO (recombination protein O)